MKRSIAVAIRFLCAIIPGCAILVLAIMMLKHGEKPSVEMLLNHMPLSGWTAAVVLWGMFALKSLSIVFPLALLFAVSGVLYPLPQAILVNLIGLGITVSVPYLIGQHYGTPLIHKLVCKYPKIAELQKWERHDFLHTFTIRAAGFLPCDVVSMYMGASEVSYAPYLCGSLAGCFLNLLTTTILGVHIDHPQSPIFVASLIVQALLFLLSCCFYLFHIRKSDHD